MTKSWPTAADAFTAVTPSDRSKVANSPSARTLACVFPSFNEVAVLHIRFEDVRKQPFPHVVIRTVTVMNTVQGRHAKGGHLLHEGSVFFLMGWQLRVAPKQYGDKLTVEAPTPTVDMRALLALRERKIQEMFAKEKAVSIETQPISRET